MIGLLLAAALSCRADGGPTQSDPYQLQRVQAIVSRAHAFLREKQNPDGSFSILRREEGAAAPVAVTGLAALSFLAAGDGSPACGRAVDWLVSHCDERGYFSVENDGVSRMHGQGYALLALTQAYGVVGLEPDQRRRMGEAIVRALRLIEGTQGDRGGWYYEPERSSMHEGSITVCLIQALRAARDAGFVVDTGCIQRALKYMADSQDGESGRFRYAINDPKTSWALTAAALSTLNALGDYGSDKLELGFEALREADPLIGGGEYEYFYQYGALYAAQAYWQHQDRRVFEKWWAEYVDECEGQQHSDGRFTNLQYGDVFATTIVSLSLQVPLGYLPIFQR